MSKSHYRLLLVLYATTLFLSAALLFWVQPLLAKMLLPHLGGSPAVWNTCMMYFQGTLLVGYLYAYCSSRFLPRNWQPILQIILLCTGLVFLPFYAPAHWIGLDQSPIFNLIRLLVFTTVIPILAISASAPMLQRWFALSDHPDASDPYFLYAASNSGSLLALLAFPFLLEPWLAISTQRWVWSGGFILLLLFTAVCAYRTFMHGSAYVIPRVASKSASHLSEHVDWKTRGSWVLLAFVPSSLLLGVTTYITTDIASAPLFWIIPLVLYLLSFIIVFSRKPIIKPYIAAFFQLLFAVLFLIVFARDVHGFNYWVVLLLNLFLFFATALVLHGELVRQRPHASHLTEFYLWMAFGGFLGGVFNTLIAPLIFVDVIEYPLMIAVAILVKPPLPIKRYLILAVIILIVVSLHFTSTGSRGTIHTVRNFFGTSHVFVQPGNVHMLAHGTTKHGLEVRNKKPEHNAKGFYMAVEEVINLMHKKQSSLSIGIIGLGAGMNACLAGPQDTLTYYEINPAVVDIASNPAYFSYLTNCPPKGGIIVGDARLRLAEAKKNQYDLLVVDAFNSDSIPIHLITEEAILLYFQKIKSNGVVLVHVSNRYINLHRVLSASSYAHKITPLIKGYKKNIKTYAYFAEWVALTKSSDRIDTLKRNGWKVLPMFNKKHRWRDDYSNIIRELRLFQ
ncbi:MAG: fused MFS/spermidine synthase [Coxiellaceae bacterium]|nr:fused MFS/spermidine synthase [Coxiellaceae bacterium]